MQRPVEIGGYFGLDLPDYGECRMFSNGHFVQSARAAIHAALACNGFNRVLMPGYICNSIIQAAQEAGLRVETYDLDGTLYPKELPQALAPGCAVLYVNYFGLCGHHVRVLAQQMPSGKTIIDNSHALFAPNEEGVLATAYSPRKFVGLPDGGVLAASPQLQFTPPVTEDSGSFDRMRYLVRRMAYSARAGYEDFDAARRSLSDTKPLAMSRLTRRLMRSIRWNDVRARRRENYTVMAAMLDRVNNFYWPLADEHVPLIYPLTLRGRQVDDIRTELAANNIFSATYWKDALPRAKAGSVEAALINETLFLPIDQRMSLEQVEAVARTVLKLIGHRK
jgi:hypothetical protein